MQTKGETNLAFIEQFSIDCHKTKTKVITPANHKGRGQPNEPIKTRIQ